MLIDELTAIEKDNISARWPETTKQLAEFMRDRAKNNGWGAILVSTCSRQASVALTAWAKQEGLCVELGKGGSSVWLIWGHTPIIYSGSDAEIMSDGSLKIRRNPA